MDCGNFNLSRISIAFPISSIYMYPKCKKKKNNKQQQKTETNVVIEKLKFGGNILVFILLHPALGGSPPLKLIKYENSGSDIF